MQSKETKTSTAKSYKRELAVALFLWLAYIVETKEPEVVTILAFPVFTFGALAFGMSWYSPNGGLLKPQSSGDADRGRGQHSGQHTSWEDQQPDSRNHQHNRTETGETSSENHTSDSRYQQGKF